MSAASRILLLLTASGAWLGAGGAAHAREPLGFPLRFGVYGGWLATSGDFDVLGERREGLVPGAGPTFGVRAGWRMSEAFALELDGGMVLAPVRDELAWLVPARLTLAWRPLSPRVSAVTPIVALGGGVFAHAGGPGGGDVDALWSGGLGVEVRLDEAAALRLEGGVLVTDGVASAASWSPVVTLGIDLLAWREREADLRDERPRSGPDREREGPTPAGCPRGARVALCVDSDDDGRIDAYDRCPVDAALRHDGCPDPDGDGRTGLDDACPRDRGERADWGCPR